MKHFVYYFFAVLFLTLYLTSGCEQDKCKEIDCGAMGTCNPTDGSCNCGTGYVVSPITGKCVGVCEGKDCGIGGVCNPTTGKCDCSEDYEQAADGKCSIETRQKFIGKWYATDCGASSLHEIDITASAFLNQIDIKNYAVVDCGGFPLIATATIKPDRKSFQVQSTSTCPGLSLAPGPGNSATISSSGTSLTLNYNVEISGTVFNCTLTYTKQ